MDILESILNERKVKQDKDIEDRKGTQPSKYYAKDADGDEMSKSTKQKRAAHFAQKKDGPAPGDGDAETKPSKHTKKYKDMYEDAGKSLAKKADKSGISKGILQQVYNRGVAAWKTGHRPGTTPEQWGHARVNSFITKGKGTWGGADKDLAKKAGASESVQEGKLVTTVHDIVGVIMKRVAAKLEADYAKNPEKGIGMINTIGAIIKHKVTDKKQEKGKLFLKFGDNLEGDELFEDAAVDAAELKAKQAGELERLKQRQEDELEALTKRHEREQERVDGQKEKETADKQIQAKRDADRKKSEAQSESFKTLLKLRGIK